ncbi:MAG: TldD/PmbA family protein [Chloroflexi bacterium]|nr:TldD/PmbA family protein [Chloroflexota bacterium]
MEQLLALAMRAADEAEVYQEISSGTPVSFESNRLKMLQTKETRGMALRIIRNGRIGFSSSTNLMDPKALVDSALAVSEFGAEAKFGLPNSSISREVQVYDPIVEGVSVETMIAMGQSMVDMLRGYNPDILCDAGVSRSSATVRIVNSAGTDLSYEKTVMAGSIHGNLVRGTDMLDIYDSKVTCGMVASYDEIAQEVIKKFELAARTADVTTKPMPVIFTPKGASATLLLPLQSAFSGKSVLQGASPIGDKLNQKAFDERFSIYDDATIDLAPGSAICDDEGVPTRRTSLAEKGIVRNFYYDLQTAGLAGRKSTGNGYRSLATMPSPALSTLIFEPGDTEYEDMIADIKEGIVVEQVMGAWAGNVLSGDFSANVYLGYKIENGTIVGRVKNTMVAGNVFEIFKNNLVALGARSVWVGGTLKIPAMYFHSLSISTKQ